MLYLIPAPLHRLALRPAHWVLTRWRRFSRRPFAGVTLVAANDDGQVLLARHSYGRPVWSLPGGGINRGEDPDAAARRELREECSCEALELDSIAILSNSVAGASHTAHIYAVRIGGHVRPDGREVIELRFFDPGDLPTDIGGFSRSSIARWQKWRGQKWREVGG